MRIKVMDEFGNVAFEVDTPEQALALRRGLTTTTPAVPERKSKAAKKASKASETRHKALRVRNLRNALTDLVATPAGMSTTSMNILKALPEMTASGKPWSMDKFAAFLKLESAKKLPPLMMQFRKDIDRLDLQFDQVITRRIAYTGGRKYSFYTPGPMAAEALKRATDKEKTTGNLFISHVAVG